MLEPADVAADATSAAPATPNPAAPMQRADTIRGKRRRWVDGQERSFERMTGLLLRGASSVEMWQQLLAKLTPDVRQF
jgi:hypothetical protein